MLHEDPGHSTVTGRFVFRPGRSSKVFYSIEVEGDLIGRLGFSLPK